MVQPDFCIVGLVLHNIFGQELDEALELKMKPFLYNEGRGKKVSSSSKSSLSSLLIHLFIHHNYHHLRNIGADRSADLHEKLGPLNI